MTSSIRGYLVANNLVETSQDRQALNNIGGAPIADDIALFVNNTNNKSIISIRADEYDQSEDRINLNNLTIDEATERNSVFTNGDRIDIVDVNGDIIADNVYIANSNARDSFQISSTENLSSIYSIPLPSQTDENNYVIRFVREDSVSFENLQRLGVESSGVEVNLPDTDGATDEEASSINVGNYDDEFSEITGFIDLANFRSRNKFVANESTATDVRIRTEGGVIIADPSDTIISEGIAPSSPGLYLSNPSSPVDNIGVTRAFSSSSNPWTDNNAGTLSTESIDVTAGNLILSDGISIDGIGLIPESGTVDSTTFSHKVKVTIDEIDYYLCLTT